MKNAKVILGPDVEAAIIDLIDYVELDEIPAVLDFLEGIQARLKDTLSAYPEGGTRFQGNVRMFTVKRYSFLYEYYPDTNEAYVLEMKAPGRVW